MIRKKNGQKQFAISLEWPFSYQGNFMDSNYWLSLGVQIFTAIICQAQDLDPRSPTGEMERVLNPEPFPEFRAVGCGWAGGSAGEGEQQRNVGIFWCSI